jgi:hypothetical protein
MWYSGYRCFDYNFLRDSKAISWFTYSFWKSYNDFVIHRDSIVFCSSSEGDTDLRDISQTELRTLSYPAGKKKGDEFFGDVNQGLSP